MDYPVLLRASKARDSATDYLIGNPHAREGLVARVYADLNAARLSAVSPNLKAALEAILRVDVSDQSDFRACAEALIEVRAIAAEALAPLYDATSPNPLPRKMLVG